MTSNDMSTKYVTVSCDLHVCHDCEVTLDKGYRHFLFDKYKHQLISESFGGITHTNNVNTNSNKDKTKSEYFLCARYL